MTFGFTRDSLIWWLVIFGSLITYLIGAGKSPTEWNYQEWLQAASFVVSTVAGKLATSPLSHSEYREKKITPEDSGYPPIPGPLPPPPPPPSKP